MGLFFLNIFCKDFGRVLRSFGEFSFVIIDHICMLYTFDGRKSCSSSSGKTSHYLQGFVDLNWCRSYQWLTIISMTYHHLVSVLIIAIVSWLGYGTVCSCYSSDSRAGEDPTRYAGEGTILANGSKQTPWKTHKSLSWLGQKTAPKLAHHTFGDSIPCHWTSLIFCVSGYRRTIKTFFPSTKGHDILSFLENQRWKTSLLPKSFFLRWGSNFCHLRWSVS